jgi:hypothetical protein
MLTCWLSLRANGSLTLSRGRPSGTTSNFTPQMAKATPYCRLARQHTAGALEILLRVMRDRESGAGARTSAANILFDENKGWTDNPNTSLRGGGVPTSKVR